MQLLQAKIVACSIKPTSAGVILIECSQILMHELKDHNVHIYNAGMFVQ